MNERGDGEENHDHIFEHREYFRDVLARIREIMHRDFSMTEVTIRPLGAGGARLSIPVTIEGFDKDHNQVRYFGKIIGTTDLVTARTIQFFKNIYLQMNSMEAMFEIIQSPEHLAKHQYEIGMAIYNLGIPTAKPMGCYSLDGKLWLVVSEFLNAHPMADKDYLKEEYVDTVFSYLQKMHKNGIFHGDLKPENVMIGDKVYIIDVGHFTESAPTDEKQAYDVASEMASLAEHVPCENLVRIAHRYYSRKQVKKVASYLDLVQRRPDINLSDENKNKLMRLLK